MSIIKLQTQLRELGRIRMGVKGTSKSGSTYPKAIDTWRLTSPDRHALEVAASLYGGTVAPWAGSPGQWELLTESSELDIILAPVDLSQWYEQWSKGGCTHRCNGETCTIVRGEATEEVPCLCDPEDRDCKLVTRLSVFLHRIPGIGCWRLDTGGIYAAMELPVTAQQLIALSKQGHLVPAKLAIAQRERNAKGQTKKFVVPEIRVQQTLEQIMSGQGAISLQAPEPASAPALARGPAQLPSKVCDEDGVVIEETESQRLPTSESEQVGYLAEQFGPEKAELLRQECEARGVDFAKIDRLARDNGVTEFEAVQLAIVKTAKTLGARE